MSIHFLILGSTGAIGTLFVKRALAQGHRLTLYARNPSKLDVDVQQHDRVKVIEGELSNEASLRTAAECGATVLVSCAGPLGNNDGTPIADCYKHLLPLLATNNFTRAILLCTPSNAHTGDRFSALWWFGRNFMWLFRHSEYDETLSVGQLVTQHCPAELDWTLFRVGGLTDSKAKPVEATMLGSGNDKVTISRDSVAAWVLEEAEMGRWKKGAPYICNA